MGGCPGDTEPRMSPSAHEKRLFLSITPKGCSRFAPATVGSQNTWRIPAAPLQAPSPTVSDPPHPPPNHTGHLYTQAEQTPLLSKKEKYLLIFFPRGVPQGEGTKPGGVASTPSTEFQGLFDVLSCFPGSPQGGKGGVCLGSTRHVFSNQRTVWRCHCC